MSDFDVMPVGSIARMKRLEKLEEAVAAIAAHDVTLAVMLKRRGAVLEPSATR